MNELLEKERKMQKKDDLKKHRNGNALQIKSCLASLDPEVAKVYAEQIPAVENGITESVKGYHSFLGKGLESCERSLEECYRTEDEILSALKKEADKESTSFEQKQYYFEKMAEASKRKGDKDTEHRNTVNEGNIKGGFMLMLGIVLTAGVFSGKLDIKLPKINRK